MNKSIRTAATLLVAAQFACVLGFAQSSGEATYKAKCVNCHGPNGLANSGIGKVMKVKPATDPEVQKLSLQTMIEDVRNGVGRMQAYKDSLTAAQIKDSVVYFRTFMK